MLLNWIYEFKHRRLIRKAKLELELAQVMCQHEYKYIGKYTKELYNGFDVDFMKNYRAKCVKCSKVVDNYQYDNLKVLCDLKD